MKGTITDEEWRRLQERALKANPELNATFGKAATERRLQAAKNYNRRDQN